MSTSNKLLISKIEQSVQKCSVGNITGEYGGKSTVDRPILSTIKERVKIFRNCENHW